MKAKALLFMTQKCRDINLARFLKGKDVHLHITHSIGPLHTALARYEYDAIIICQRTFQDRGIDPEKHLARACSLHTLIIYKANIDNQKPYIEIIQNKNSKMNDKITFIATLVESWMHERYEIMSDNEVKENSPCYESNHLALPENTSLSLMQKQIFTLLSNSGQLGCTNQEIQLALWQDQLRNRKKDVQSYVCTLRKKLKRVKSRDHLLSVSFKSGRYYLEKKAGT